MWQGHVKPLSNPAVFFLIILVFTYVSFKSKNIYLSLLSAAINELALRMLMHVGSHDAENAELHLAFSIVK